MFKLQSGMYVINNNSYIYIAKYRPESYDLQPLNKVLELQMNTKQNVANYKTQFTNVMFSESC